jgi:orotidine-5'-phosphate decarboxylase
MSYWERLESRITASGSRLCVGLDLRAHDVLAAESEVRKIIEETSAHAAAFKPNSAYFEAMGWEGYRLLERLRGWIPSDIPMILDVKRGDIGETAGYYARACFEVMGADAVTLSPYMGRDSVVPYLEVAGCGIYLLGVTSNPGSADLQRRELAGGGSVFELVGEMAVELGTGLVVGLTHAGGVMGSIPDVPLLVPGLGAQGGELGGLGGVGRKAPLVVNVSRGILYGDAGTSYGERARHYARKISDAIA